MKFLLLILFILSFNSFSHDCLNYDQKKYRNNPKFNILTVKGDTYVKAQFQMKKQMPNIGFNQNIKYEEVKKMTNVDYTEDKRFKRNLKASVDQWKTYSCKHEGEFYITAIVPKQGIKYIDFKYAKDPDFNNIAKMKKLCFPYRKIVVLGYENIDSFLNYSGQKVFGQSKKYKDNDGYEWLILCGDVKLSYCFKGNKSNYCDTWDNILEDGFFKAILDKSTEGSRYKPHNTAQHLKDVTVELWTELIKND